MCDFYYMPASPPCRSVLMLANALGVPLNLKTVNIMAQEHLTPEYLKINPQHSIPTLVDNNFVIWESRAILSYLVEKYGKNDSLYPKDPKKRAIVNQRLYFDMGTLYSRFSDWFYPQMREQKPADPEKYKKIEEAVQWLDGFLASSKYTAGDKVTIADYALFASLSTFETAGFNYSAYENVKRWYAECKNSLPGVEENEKGIEVMKAFMSSMLKK